MTDDTTENMLQQLSQWQDGADIDTLARFDPRTLCRVSLLPEWTLAFATELSLVRPEEVPALVEQLAEADLIEQRVRRDLTDEVRESFWVRTRHRREIGDYVRERLGSELFDQYTVLCDQVRATGRPEFESWLEIRRFAADPSGQLLLDRVNQLIQDDDLPTAITTVAITQVVGDVLGGTLEDAVRRAQWRLDHEYRTRDDLAHLDGYHRRGEIEDVLADLVTGEEPWALHLLGHAGVGKTMTVRHLASGRLATDRGMARFPVARVDFDHLDPRYPERRPADLLVAMTDELLGFATTRAAEHSYRAIRDAADALHEELSRSNPDDATVEVLRQDVVERFANLVEQLPAPVVLVLDTCEELAKLYTAGAPAPAIDQTFDLLEQVHRRAPRIRVVLAGRRRLVKPPEDRPYGGPRLLERAYVRVERMRGFTQADAEAYLNKQNIPSRLHQALLQRSADGDRYNPFELAGLCDWAHDEPDLDLTGETTADPYVERRILARVQDRHVKAALPVAVALGEFDRALIAPALTRAGIDVEAAFDGLSAQEWVNVRSLGADGRPNVIEIDEHIRERLRAAMTRSTTGHTPDLVSLGRDAAAVIKASPLPEVSTETVVAAVRLLPPTEAAELWDTIDTRIRGDHEWAWPLQVAPRVAATEQHRSGQSILAAILATEASARLHNGHTDGLGALWTTVSKHAERHPDVFVGVRLAARAILNQIPVSQPTRRVLTHLLSDARMQRAFTVAPPDTMLAMLEHLAPQEAWTGATLLVPLTIDLLEAESARISAGAAVLLAGFWLSGKFTGSVTTTLDRAMLALQKEMNTETEDPPDWPDWVSPHRLLERLRLMRVLVALYGGEPLDRETARRWIPDHDSPPGDIDADRLRAALLDYELAFTVDVDFPAIPLRLSGHRVPWLHEGFGRPLAVAVADSLSQRGDHKEAAKLLLDFRKEAVGLGDQAEAVEAYDLALLRLCRTTRTTKYAAVLRLASEGSPRLRDEAWLVLRMAEQNTDDQWAEFSSPFGRLRCGPPGTLPLDMARRWAADHLDLWEADLLKVKSNRSTLPAGGRLALGRSALMAGEIRSLNWPQNAVELLEHAERELAAAGATHGAKRARALKNLTERKENYATPLRQGRFARSSNGFTQVAREAATRLRQRVRQYLVVRTRVQLSYLISITLFATLTAVVQAFFGAPPNWITLSLIATLPAFIILDMTLNRLSIKILRLVFRSEKHRLSLSAYRSLRPSLLGYIPNRPSRRKRFATPIWHQNYEPTDSELPEILFDGLPVGGVVSRLLAMRIRVFLLEIPRELHFRSRWEWALGQAVPRRLIPRVLWVRRLPGRSPWISRSDWLSRSKSFHGPVRFQPTSEAAPETGPRLLVHVVGSPVRTSAGWQIRVRDATGLEARTTSRGAGYREKLIDLQELTREPVALLVLQADPLGPLPEPLGSDRDGFVRAASAAVDLHADAVLVIPPLPDDLARRTIDATWHAVNKSIPLSNFILFSIVANLKNLVYKAGGPDNDTVPACLDILLFLRSEGAPWPDSQTSSGTE